MTFFVTQSTWRNHTSTNCKRFTEKILDRINYIPPSLPSHELCKISQSNYVSEGASSKTFANVVTTFTLTE